MPVTWGVAIFAANLAAWEALPPDLRALLRRELPKLEVAIWEQSAKDTLEGIACSTGTAGCTLPNKGAMTLVPVSAQDERRRQEIFMSTVLPRWLQRCGPRGVEIWNKTIGPDRGITAATSP
jgi:TRAP-type C4-dicarboxylate transport system substrate-binding protein